MERPSTPDSGWVILSTIAVAGRRHSNNGSTAINWHHQERKHHRSSSDMNPALFPTIVCEAGDALLPSVNVRSEPYCRSDDRATTSYTACRRGDACP
ncbi:Os07g0683250 [Oryza sativa Japonica Group]|uniref:Os07g0683250 protein n=2 Tax=Oryza sativa subsp. japonica TaxID=39947 RepID=Q6Z4N8_ORYSJ|nr:hypothetical protein [Oryza sativa Japonica Group]BAT03264.1 Os07g0683250 [Oryza sativa Japonica Group]